MKTINRTIEFDAPFLGEMWVYEVEYTAEIKSAVGCRDEWGREEIVDDSEIVINDLWFFSETKGNITIPNTEQYADVYKAAWKAIELDIDKQK